MTATSIGVDRVAERHAGGGGDLVDDPAGVDLEELHAAELAGADMPLAGLEGAGVEQRLLRRPARRRFLLVGEAPPELGHAAQHIERMFATSPALTGWTKPPDYSVVSSISGASWTSVSGASWTSVSGV